MIINRTSKNNGVVDNEPCHFLESSMLHISGYQYHVPNNDVFYSHGQLHSGIICKRTVIEQKIGNFITGTQEFFQVVDSAVKEIQEGDLVIVRERTSSQFIAYNQSLVFVTDNNVLLVARNGYGVIPGPLYELLWPDHDGFDNNNIEKIKSVDGKYFDHYTLKLVIGGKLALVVAKKDIKIIQDTFSRTK